MEHVCSALSPKRAAWGSAGILALAFCITPAVRSAVAPGGPRNDFVSFYSAAQLAGSPDLYDGGLTAARQRALGLNEKQYLLPYVRLPFYAVLLSPIAWIPFGAPYWVWEALLIASFAVAAFVWHRHAPAAVLFAAGWNAGLAIALIRGQDTPIVFFILSIAAWVLYRRPLTAGFLFSLCLIKWHLFLLLPVFVIARREWRFAGAFAVGAAGLIAWSTWLNPEWIRVYHTAIMAPDLTPNQGIMPSIHGLARGLPWAAAAGTLVVGALSWMAMKRAPDSKAAIAVLFLGGVSRYLQESFFHGWHPLSGIGTVRSQ